MIVHTHRQTHRALKAETHFLKSHHRTTAQDSLPFARDTTAFLAHYRRIFYRSRPRKSSVWFAGDPLHVCHIYKWPPLLTPPSLIHCSSMPSPLLSRSATQPFRSVSHGSTLIIWLTAGSSTCFPSMDFLLQHPRFTNFCFL